jgi:hypothetical protein
MFVYIYVIPPKKCAPEKCQIPPETPCIYPIRFLKLAGNSAKYISVLYEYVVIGGSN